MSDTLIFTVGLRCEKAECLVFERCWGGSVAECLKFERLVAVVWGGEGGWRTWSDAICVKEDALRASGDVVGRRGFAVSAESERPALGGADFVLEDVMRSD